jgi:hypothetical protein
MLGVSEIRKFYADLKTTEQWRMKLDCYSFTFLSSNNRGDYRVRESYVMSIYFGYLTRAADCSNTVHNLYTPHVSDQARCRLWRLTTTTLNTDQSRGRRILFLLHIDLQAPLKLPCNTHKSTLITIIIIFHCILFHCHCSFVL